MGVLSNLQPKEVFAYFEEICNIPHGSYNTKEISDYLVDFAKKRNLEYHQDEVNNVIIIKEASAGYEKAEPLIIQGHIDMVCQKADGKDFDFEKDGLQLMVDGDHVTADGTTLGADNGIAVAMALAILDSNEIAHPRLECVFTTEEEVGMDGAHALDVSPLTAKKFLNLDSEEEGIFTVSCAGGVTITIDIPVEMASAKGKGLKLEVSGLKGGHSGIMIGEERASATKELARALWEISKVSELRLVSLEAGLKDNAICNLARAEVIIEEGKKEKVLEIVVALDKVMKHEYKVSDPGITLKAEECQASDVAYTLESSNRVITFIQNSPQGIQNMSKEIDGLVETSLNLGVARLEGDHFKAVYAARSSVNSRIDKMIGSLEALANMLGGSMSTSGRYPGWEYKADSKLREDAARIFKDMFGKEPKIEAIHAGLECGIFAGKLGSELDCVSLGPDIRGAHTTEETLSISSTERTWDLVLRLLKESK